MTHLLTLGAFTLHAGGTSDVKIDCDALTDEDITAAAVIIARSIPAFGAVFGIPRGGTRLAQALSPYRTDVAMTAIVDDVWNTGSSMRETVEASGVPLNKTQGVVLFARTPTPWWVFSLFQLHHDAVV